MKISHGFTCMKLIETGGGMVGTRVENDGEGRIPAVPGFQSGEMTWAVIYSSA